MVGLLLELQVVKKQFNIYKETEFSAPQVDCVLYQFPDMSSARTEKRSPEPTEARSPKTNIQIYWTSYTEYSNTSFGIRSHP